MLEQLGQLGHYNLLERVGAGGLGPAFKARDTVVGRTVLVKNVAEALGSDPGARTRFLRDQRAAATISHPNVATLFEVADRPDQLLLVFEFVSGQTLEELPAERPPEVRQSLDLGVQLVEAIGAAHSQGVLHLDVRPANIKISLRGHAKLLDTGLSAWTRGGRAGSGSVDDRAVRDRDDRYRSPEQRRGEAPDPGSDLYSIGVVLSEMLAGRAPADGASPGRATRPGSEPDTAAVPPELAAIVKRAMVEQVEDRYQSAVSFGAELRSVAAILDIRSGEREPPSRVTATEEPSQRSSGWVIPFLAVLALAFGAWLWLR